MKRKLFQNVKLCFAICHNFDVLFVLSTTLKRLFYNVYATKTNFFVMCKFPWSKPSRRSRALAEITKFLIGVEHCDSVSSSPCNSNLLIFYMYCVRFSILIIMPDKVFKFDHNLINNHNKLKTHLVILVTNQKC